MKVEEPIKNINRMEQDPGLNLENNNLLDILNIFNLIYIPYFTKY